MPGRLVSFPQSTWPQSRLRTSAPQSRQCSSAGHAAANPLRKVAALGHGSGTCCFTSPAACWRQVWHEAWQNRCHLHKQSHAVPFPKPLPLTHSISCERQDSTPTVPAHDDMAAENHAGPHTSRKDSTQNQLHMLLACTFPEGMNICIV